ncbi:hypothetical protein NW762_007608 [Fusarium torreyae]|uniref:Zn(2)-C6 fungal-type domain-containing protein n=1 Tax=Fusarium torreyae TaxID=1237075 RepID=A0A9W8RXC8_9HYPO|nr:hypothetical protein NW762_007608 [Fusarium torreyae]
MEPQNKRMRLGIKSCTECRRRKVKCMFDERQNECRQCKAHSLVCQSQYASSPSSDDKDQMIQELTQFVGQVEKRMASMQAAIDTLASKLGSKANHNANPENGAGAARDGLSENPDQQDEVRNLRKPQNAKLRSDLIAKLELQILRPRLKSMIDDLPNRPTLSKILEYTQATWMSWPLSTKQSFQKVTPSSLSCVLVKTFDAGFPMSTEKNSALSFVDNSLHSRDFGVISKCLIWLCLSFQKLPKDFKDVETGLPLRSQKLITRYLATVETFYQVSSTPACNIDFVQAIVLQYELFVSMGRLSAAWKCIRAGIENAMILGLYRSQSSLHQGVWEALWIRDRQLSLFLGLPYGVPEHLTLTTTGEEYPMPETEVFRKIAAISGHISERDQLGQDAEISCMPVEMDELKAMIPDDWGTKVEFESAFSFAQVFVHTNIRLFYHTLNQMVHLPYARLANEDRSYEQIKIAALESAEGAIRAYQDMRALEVKPYGPASSEFLHFLAFSAAVILAVDLVSQETSRSAEEERRLWTMITELASRMRETCRVLDSAVASQAAEVLENLQAACSGTFDGLEPYVVTIPFFGRILINARRHSQSEVTKNIVVLETNVFSSRMPDEYATEWDLADDWSKGADDDLYYEWKGVYEFSASN